jgi:predicted dehydrogenase
MEALKFGIFGTGTMAETYARLLSERDDAIITAFVGNTADKTKCIAQRFGVAAFSHSDYAGMFNAVGPLDAVVIATPEWIRYDPLKESVRNNVSILLEKPFADTWAEAKKLHVLLKDHKRTIGMCHVLRFSPRFNAMKKAIDEGKIGEVRQIYARRNSSIQRVQRVLGKTNLAFWLTPHDLDMIQWIVPARVEKIFALSRGKAETSDDFITISMQFENRVTAVLEISWCGPPVSGSSREAVFEVRGNGGNIEVNDFDMNLRIFGAEERVSTADTYEDYTLNGRSRGYFFELIDDFVRRVKTRSQDDQLLSKTLETTRICEMIRISVQDERVVYSHELS